MSIRSNRPFVVSTSTLFCDRSKHDNKTLVLSVSAGTAVTLAAATGSGFRARFVVGTASNANTFFASGSSTFVGGILQGDSGDTDLASLSLMQPATAGNNTLSPTTAGGGGLAGDWVQFEDFASGKWLVTGAFQGVVDLTNRFSTV